MVGSHRRFGKICRSLVPGLRDCLSFEHGKISCRETSVKTTILCCVISQNSADLMRVLSGGTKEHHKSTVNIIRLIADI